MSELETVVVDDELGGATSGGWSVPRLVAAVLTTGAAALVALVVWTVGQAQYLNDYCTSRAPRPATATPEALSGRPGYLSGPVTVRCEYDGLATVELTDPVPLLGALLLAAVVLSVAFRPVHPPLEWPAWLVWC